jgi:hypothetical protein
MVPATITTSRKVVRRRRNGLKPIGAS